MGFLWPSDKCRSNPARDFDFDLDSFINAIQLAYGTSVVLLRCPLVPEIFIPQYCKAGKSPYTISSVGVT